MSETREQMTTRLIECLFASEVLPDEDREAIAATLRAAPAPEFNTPVVSTDALRAHTLRDVLTQEIARVERECSIPAVQDKVKLSLAQARAVLSALASTREDREQALRALHADILARWQTSLVPAMNQPTPAHVLTIMGHVNDAVADALQGSAGGNAQIAESLGLHPAVRVGAAWTTTPTED